MAQDAKPQSLVWRLIPHIVFWVACACSLWVAIPLWGAGSFHSRFPGQREMPLFGLVLAGCALIAAYAAFGSGRYWMRLLISVALWLLVYGLWLVARLAYEEWWRWRFGQTSPHEIVDEIKLVPLSYWAAVGPMHLLRMLLAWRIGRQDGHSFAGGQWSLSDMLALTAAVAATMGIVMWAFRTAEFALDEMYEWPGVIIATGVIAAFGLITLPLLLIVTLRPGRWLKQLPLCAGAIVMIVAMPTDLVMLGDASADDFALALAKMLAAYSASAVVVLLMLRKCGYRLHWGWTPAAAAPTH